jgi:TctA family transporter
VLGPTTENSIRQTLKMFKGNVFLMTGRSVAMTLLAVAALFLVVKCLSPFSGKKMAVKAEEPG